jgi:hypothetical protein
MKYVKLLCTFPDGRGGKRQSTEWNLVIETIGDLMKYAEVNTELAVKALFRAERKPDNSGYEVVHIDDHRQQQVATFMNIKIAALHEGEYLHPFNELTRVLDLKTRGMLKTLQTCGAVRVNELGGYCGLQDYLMTWNGQILETIEKDDVGFPIEADVLAAEVLVLENQHNVGSNLIEAVQKITGCKPQFITLMKEKDQEWVLKCIKKAKTIAFESIFQDTDQLDGFMYFFSKLPRKRIIIKVADYHKHKLTDHPLYADNSKFHEIIFL